MPFAIPTLSQIRDYVTALGKALFPDLNYSSKRSFHGRRTTFMSGAMAELHAHVDAAQLDVHPLTAGDGKPINDWGTAFGVERGPATPGRKSAAGRVRGAAATVVATGLELRHEATGLLFETTSGGTIPGILGDDDSFIDVDIAALSTGSATRLSAGETLSMTTTPPGLETQVVLQLALDEDGFDEEPYGSYRARVLGTMSTSASGGNQYDFARWARESLDTIRDAYAYPNRAGRGTIDIVAFYAGTGTSRSISAPDRATVEAYIRTKAPFQVSGDGGAMRVLVTTPDPRRVEIVVETNGISAFSFHWDDSTPLVVSTWTDLTRQLKFTAALPASLRAGHSLVLDGVASSQDGREYKIESIAAADTVVLEVAPIVAPVATDLAYSGGPLVKPIRDAIVAHMNGQIVYAGKGLTPLPEESAGSIVDLDILATGIGPANPGGIYNDTVAWSGSLLRSVLSKISTYKSGVQNVTIITPAADYDALDDAFPADAQIHYITPGAVVIRGAS